MFINRNPDYFLTVARERNITRAAEKLFITQSSLSQHIARLERELGAQLLDRSQNPLALTDAGRTYLRYLENTSYMYQQLLGDLNSDRLQSVDVGVSSWRASILMPQVLPGFLCRSPGAQVNLHEFPVSELPSRLEDGEFDFAVMNTSAVTIPRGIVSETIVYEPILLVMNREDPLAREFEQDVGQKRPPDLHRLEGRRYIALDADLTVGRHVENFLKRSKLSFSNKLNTMNNGTALRLVAAGLGFCFMIGPGLRSAEDSGLLAFDLRVPELSLPFSLLSRANAYLSPLAQQLIDEIRTCCLASARRDGAIPLN